MSSAYCGGSWRTVSEPTFLSLALVELVRRQPDLVPALEELQRLVALIQDNAIASNQVWDDKTKRPRARLCRSRISAGIATGVCAQVWLDLQAAIDACPAPAGTVQPSPSSPTNAGQVH